MPRNADRQERRVVEDQTAVVSIIVCIIYLIGTVSISLIGAHGTIANLDRKVPAIQAQLRVATGEWTKKTFLTDRLEHLPANLPGLPWSVSETHEECLEHGIHFADEHYASYDFTEFLDIRNGTTSWVEFQCAARHFPVKVFEPGTTKDGLTSKTRRNLAAIFHTLKHLTLSVHDKLTRWMRVKLKKRNAAKPAEVAPVIKKDWSLLPLPHNFTLAECETSRCRLSYTLTANESTSINTTTAANISTAAIRALEIERAMLLANISIVSLLERDMHSFFVSLLLMQAYEMLRQLIARWNLTHREAQQPAEQRLLLWLVVESFIIPIRMLFNEYQHHMSLNLATMLLAIGKVGWVLFLIPGNGRPCFAEFISAIRHRVALCMEERNERRNGPAVVGVQDEDDDSADEEEWEEADDGLDTSSWEDVMVE